MVIINGIEVRSVMTCIQTNNNILLSHPKFCYVGICKLNGELNYTIPFIHNSTKKLN